MLSDSTTTTELSRRRGTAPLWIAAAVLGFALALYGLAMHARAAWSSHEGVGYAMGIVAAIAVLLLTGYTVPKRITRLWSRRVARGRRSAEQSQQTPERTRSVVRLHYVFHGTLGLLSLGAVVAHSGGRLGASSGAAVALAFFTCAVLGIVGALAYAFVPRRLSRLERSASLPEDYAALRRELTDRMYSGVTGRGEVVKKLFEKILVPYLRSSSGWLVLLLSGRDLRAEERAVRQRVDVILEGRGSGRLAGLDELIRIAVELRALTAQRVLTAVLRGWLPLHVMTVGLTLVMLALHIFEARGP